jgi:hypothetical protein
MNLTPDLPPLIRIDVLSPDERFGELIERHDEDL